MICVCLSNLLELCKYVGVVCGYAVGLQHRHPQRKVLANLKMAGQVFKGLFFLIVVAVTGVFLLLCVLAPQLCNRVS